MKMTPDDVKNTFALDPDTGHVYWRERKRGRAFGAIGTPDRDGYLVIWMNRRRDRYPVHRIVWALVHGRWPADQIDHINGVKSDNRPENLREATTAQNMRNVGRQSHNTSGLKGVSWHRVRQNWRASIKVNQKQYHLGSFDCPAAASMAYQVAASKHHGEFARGL